LFGWIEKRFGGSLPMDSTVQGGKGQVIVRDRYIEPQDLIQLTAHEALAIHVKQFYPVAAAVRLGQTLSEDVTLRGRGKNWKISTSRGLESSDVQTLGEHPPYNVVATANKASQSNLTIDDYFRGVQQELRSRRMSGQVESASGGNEAQPQLWPLDLLRLHLDEIWPSGAGLARETSAKKGQFSRPYSGGLPRIMRGPTRWKQGFIHVDEMAPLNPKSGLFSANIYLQIPGAEATAKERNNGDHSIPPVPGLHVWPLGVRTRWDWYRNAILLSGLGSQDPEMQFRLRHELGPPLQIEVAPGDLILLCVQRPHAAVGFANPDAVRVSLQCFIQHNGRDKRLSIDS
jgi:hypothetical protein